MIECRWGGLCRLTCTPGPYIVPWPWPYVGGFRLAGAIVWPNSRDGCVLNRSPQTSCPSSLLAPCSPHCSRAQQPCVKRRRRCGQPHLCQRWRRQPRRPFRWAACLAASRGLPGGIGCSGLPALFRGRDVGRPVAQKHASCKRRWRVQGFPAMHLLAQAARPAAGLSPPAFPGGLLINIAQGPPAELSSHPLRRPVPACRRQHHNLGRRAHQQGRLAAALLRLRPSPQLFWLVDGAQGPAAQPAGRQRRCSGRRQQVRQQRRQRGCTADAAGQGVGAGGDVVRAPAVVGGADGGGQERVAGRHSLSAGGGTADGAHAVTPQPLCTTSSVNRRPALLPCASVVRWHLLGPFQAPLRFPLFFAAQYQPLCATTGVCFRLPCCSPLPRCAPPFPVHTPTPLVPAAVAPQGRQQPVPTLEPVASSVP